MSGSQLGACAADRARQSGKAVAAVAQPCHESPGDGAAAALPGDLGLDISTGSDLGEEDRPAHAPIPRAPIRHRARRAPHPARRRRPRRRRRAVPAASLPAPRPVAAPRGPPRWPSRSGRSSRRSQRSLARCDIDPEQRCRAQLAGHGQDGHGRVLVEQIGLDHQGGAWLAVSAGECHGHEIAAPHRQSS